MSSLTDTLAPSAPIRARAGDLAARATSIAPRTIVRLATAVLLLAQAAIHLDLWLTGYRDIPTIGPLFLLAVVLTVVVAVAVALRDHVLVAAAAIAVSLGQIGALLVSKYVGLFGFMSPTTFSQFERWSVVAEAAAAILASGLVVTTLLAHRRTRATGTAVTEH